METTCCFTGHRAIPASDRAALEQRLETAIARLAQNGVVFFGAGGALGFDTLAAETVLRLRSRFPQIKLILVLPCRDQAAHWSAHDRARYEAILARADKVVYVEQTYTSQCMMKRNRRLVDHSQVCVCYQTALSGGTAATVEYAKKKGLRIWNLA